MLDCNSIFIELEYKDPICYLPLLKEKQVVFFDSCHKKGEHPHGTEDYSFLCADPVFVINKAEHEMFEKLKKNYKIPLIKHNSNLPPFQGGFAGYISYDICDFLEKLPKRKIDRFNFPDICLGFFDVVLSFDHNNKKAYLISTGMKENFTFCEKTMNARLEYFKEIYTNNNTAFEEIDKKKLKTKLFCEFTRKEYEETLQKVIDYIFDGDIFQANLTRRIEGKFDDDFKSFDALYNLQRNQNPAPFSAFISFDNHKILSSSPERFIKLEENGNIETRPIKGTRPRLKNKLDDDAMIKDLENSEKDKSENLMIVDLLRNDLSRIARPHSVHVPELFSIEAYEEVYQKTSVVKAKIKENLNAFDILQNTFPGGSITGAPKIRAMEILRELEPTNRGPYCGSAIYISLSGAMDSSILIRTLMVQTNLVRGNEFYFQVGGGIVADSLPKDEFEETETKAKSFYKIFL